MHRAGVRVQHPFSVINQLNRQKQNLSRFDIVIEHKVMTKCTKKNIDFCKPEAFKVEANLRCFHMTLL